MSHTKNVADATRIICKKFHHRTTPRCKYTRGGTYLLHTSEYSSVPQLSERWRGYILWLRSSWNKSSLWGGLRFLRPSFMRFIEDSSLREEAGPREWRERDVLWHPVIRPYMGYLYLCSMVLAYLVMPCVANRSWFLISGIARGSSERQAAVGSTCCLICGKHQKLLHDFRWIWFSIQIETDIC